MSLLDALRGAGLTVKPYKYWETATNSGRDRVETVGIVNHWDAVKGEPPVTKYLYDNRFGGILYHLLIRRSGLVELLSQRYVWHAGLGSSQILDIARAGGPVPDDAAGPDNTNGNSRFLSVCVNYHPDEGPIPVRQYEALVATNAVLCDRSTLNPGQVFRHMDWTTRKRDIDTINLERFRADIGDLLMPTVDEIAAAVWAARPGGADEPTPWQQLLRIRAGVGSLARDLTSDDDLAAAVDYLLDELPPSVVDELRVRLSGNPQ